MKHAMLIVCLIFGGLMVTSFARADDIVEVEGVYCKFNLKAWDNNLKDFLETATDCKVKVKTQWGKFEYTQPLVVDPDNFNPMDLWSALTDG